MHAVLPIRVVEGGSPIRDLCLVHEPAAATRSSKQKTKEEAPFVRVMSEDGREKAMPSAGVVYTLEKASSLPSLFINEKKKTPTHTWVAKPSSFSRIFGVLTLDPRCSLFCKSGKMSDG